MDMVFASRKRSFLEKILDGLCCVDEFEIVLPSAIVERTELMCLYIKEETGQNFDVSDFLYLLYKDFVYFAVKNPVPRRILKEASRTVSVNNVEKKKEKTATETEYIKIVCNGVEYLERPVNYVEEKKEEKPIIKEKVVIIKLDKKESKKGEIILDELYHTMGVEISMEELFASLWMNFIEDYKNGVNKRAYKSIVSILKRVGLK